MADLSSDIFEKGLGRWSMRIKLLIGSIILVLALGFFLLRSFNGTVQYYLTVGEFMEQAKSGKIEPGSYLKVAGTVVPNSIHPQTSSNHQHQFEIEQGTSAMTVRYSGIMPNMFKEGAAVVVEGRYLGDFLAPFVADHILTKCASKYTEGASPLNEAK